MDPESLYAKISRSNFRGWAIRECAFRLLFRGFNFRGLPVKCENHENVRLYGITEHAYSRYQAFPPSEVGLGSRLQPITRYKIVMEYQFVHFQNHKLQQMSL